MVTSMNGPAPETPGPAHRHAGGSGPVHRSGGGRLRAGDRLLGSYGEVGADRHRIAGVNQPGTARDVVEMQVAAHGKGLEAAGAVGVAELHAAVSGGGAGAV